MSVEISPVDAKKLSGRRVLVVDEMLIRRSMAETLTHAGYEVTEAGNAREALQHVCDTRAPDVILLDCRLPDSNPRLLEAIRHTLQKSPVIMMSAFGNSDVIDGAMKLGALRVLSKPVEIQDLVPLIEQAYESLTR